eukprot:11023372-Alexandrium_andersonii.AAC.1
MYVRAQDRNQAHARGRAHAQGDVRSHARARMLRLGLSPAATRANALTLVRALTPVLVLLSARAL